MIKSWKYGIHSDLKYYSDLDALYELYYREMDNPYYLNRKIYITVNFSDIFQKWFCEWPKEAPALFSDEAISTLFKTDLWIQENLSLELENPFIYPKELLE